MLQPRADPASVFPVSRKVWERTAQQTPLNHCSLSRSPRDSIQAERDLTSNCVRFLLWPLGAVSGGLQPLAPWAEEEEAAAADRRTQQGAAERDGSAVKKKIHKNLENKKDPGWTLWDALAILHLVNQPSISSIWKFTLSSQNFHFTSVNFIHKLLSFWCWLFLNSLFIIFDSRQKKSNYLQYRQHSRNRRQLTPYE